MNVLSRPIGRLRRPTGDLRLPTKFLWRPFGDPSITTVARNRPRTSVEITSGDPEAPTVVQPTQHQRSKGESSWPHPETPTPHASPVRPKLNPRKWRPAPLDGVPARLRPRTPHFAHRGAKFCEFARSARPIAGEERGLPGDLERLISRIAAQNFARLSGQCAQSPGRSADSRLIRRALGSSSAVCGSSSRQSVHASCQNVSAALASPAKRRAWARWPRA